MSETKTVLSLNKKIMFPLIIFLGVAILLTVLILIILPYVNKNNYEWQGMSLSYPAEWTVKESIPVFHSLDYQSTNAQLLTFSSGNELAVFLIMSDHLSEKDIQAKAYKDSVFSFMDSPAEDVIASIQVSEPTATELKVSEITLNNRSWKRTEYLREYEKPYPPETIILQEVRYRGIFEDHFITVQYSCPVEDKKTLRAFEEICKSLQVH